MPSGSESPLASRLRRYALPVFVFVFPFLYFFPLVVPNSGMLLLQNDFDYLYLPYKSYLLDLWAHGHFPWWSPVEAAGYSFFADPFAAVLYPPNLLALVARLVTGAYGTWFHQIFTVAGVSVFALGLYTWLVRLFARPYAAAFAAITLSTCWSVSEFMRFPNAIHVLAWTPWVLAALHAVHHERGLRNVYKGAAFLFCQLTGGYPYFFVYACFVYAGYLLYLHVSAAWVEWKARAAREALTFGLPVLVLLPYLSAVSRLMSVTTDRAGGNYGYAISYPFGPLDLVGSLVFPPVATVEGCFYMGSLAVFLLAVYFWRGADAREKVAVLLGLLGVLSLTFGFRSFLFAPVWAVTPVINQMRAFSRLTTMLLPLLAVAVHQGFAWFSAQLEAPPRERDLAPRVVWIVFGVIFLLQGCLFVLREKLDLEYLGLTFVSLPAGSHEVDFPLYTLLTLVVVLAVLHVDWTRLRAGRALAFVILLWACKLDTGAQGRYLWTLPVDQGLTKLGAAPGDDVTQRLLAFTKRESDFYRLVRDYFELDRAGSSGYLTWRGLTRGSVPNWDYAAYTGFLRQGAGDPGSLNALLGKQKLFFHTTLAPDPKAFLADATAAHDATSGLGVTRFDGSELVVETTIREPGYVAWIDNWDEGWSAHVDGAPAPIERLLGTFKSVRLATPGRHTVSFRYRPVVSGGAWAGFALGLALLLACLLSRAARARLGRVAAP